MPTWMYCGSTLMLAVYRFGGGGVRPGHVRRSTRSPERGKLSDSECGQYALAEQHDAVRRVDAMGGTELDASSAAGGQRLDLTDDVVWVAGEGESVQHLV